ncbi:hypothetical protein FKW77_007956 [Venturia effusa]|uniref:Heterokaryon incompatibility domain-containing protein n=1 Tax=Venturia effusa TaxID=50376 RepID=A0A517L7Q4_9PEZI|nr:hypothetical protein FKW77_007956 [Venturia effusa]
MAKYDYQPIDENFQEIRLVNILAGSGDDLLIIEVNHVALPTTEPRIGPLHTNEINSDRAAGCQDYDTGNQESENLVKRDAPEFEALSYTWGPPEPAESIIILPGTSDQKHSPTPGRTLTIGPSLAGALRGLRRPTESRSMWIDAISINQQDITERSKQVPRMGDIYSMATRVIIWLGTDSNNSARAIELLDQLGSRLEQSETAGRRTRYKDSTRLPWTISEWEAIEELLTRPWFARVWILQEAQLARAAIVHCGSAQISWKSMKDAIHAVYRNLYVPIAGFRQLIDEADNTADNFLSHDVEETLLRSSSRAATDHKDKIYGALNILAQEVRDRIEVNYDFSVVQVFRSAILAINDTVHRLNLMAYGVTDEGADFNGPSWVPRFHAEAPFSPKTYHFASGVSASRVQIIDELTIEVTGRLCGTVVTIGPPVPDIHEDLPDFYNTLKTEPLLQHRTEHDLRDEVLNCLVASQLSSRLPDSMDSFSIKELREMFGSGLRKDEEGSEAWAEADATLDRALFTCYGTRLIVTQEGMVGLAPLNVEAGDQVAIFLGCDHPVLLRPSGSNFTVLGVCNIHALCDASALLGALPEPWIVQFLYSDESNTPMPQPFYINETTGERTREDPRFGELPDEWERIYSLWNRSEPRHVDYFRHKSTGEVVFSDPRLAPEALLQRGIALDHLRL